MKWLMRTLIILIAAVLVSAATAWIAPSLIPARNFRGGERGPAIAQQNTGNNAATLPAPLRRERGGGIFGLTVVLRSLLQIAIVIVPFAVYGSIKHRRKNTRTQLLS